MKRRVPVDYEEPPLPRISIPPGMHSALKLIFPMSGPNTLRFSKLQDLLGDQGIKLNAFELMWCLDFLDKAGMIRITRADETSACRVDTIEVRR